MKKLFNTFAVEPTFYFNVKQIQIPFFLKDDYNFTTDSLLDSASNYVEEELGKKVNQKKHPWLKNAYEDGSTIEVPSLLYTDKKKFLAAYERLTKFLETKFQFLPSSIIDIEQEGGCHLNVSVPKEVYNSQSAYSFFDNLQSYLTNHPSIIWSFLTPTDDQSSVVPFKSDPRYNQKGDFFTIRDKEGDDLDNRWDGATDWQGRPYFYPPDVVIDKKNGRVYRPYIHARRIELRFFMQPKNIHEMKLEVDFGLHLLNFVWYSTVRGAEWKQMNTRSSLRQYTSDKACAELKSACIEMGFDYGKLIAQGRFANLKTKFEYHHKYLV